MRCGKGGCEEGKLEWVAACHARMSSIHLLFDLP